MSTNNEEPEFNNYKGYISTEHTIWCGGCQHWHSEASPNKRVMANIMRAQGWMHTKKHGWLCPACRKKCRAR